MSYRAMSADAGRILYLVTADEATIERLQRLFAQRGFTCEAYQSGSEFLGVPHGSLDGCVITTSELPDMSATELVQQMHRGGWAFPTIILSREADVGSAVRAFRAGAVDYVELPFVDRVLLDRVNDLFARRSQH